MGSVETTHQEQPGEIGGYLAFYVEPKTDDIGIIEMELKRKIIPTHLKDLFIETFGGNIINLTTKKIDDFLNEHNGMPIL